MSRKRKIWEFKFVSPGARWITLCYIAILLALFQFIMGCQFSFDTAKKTRPEGRVVGYINLSPQQAKEMLDKNSKVVLLDIRAPEEFKKEHIKGAVSISLYELEGAIDNELWSLDAQIIVYDSSGSSSRTAVKSLIGSGYTRASNLSGGIIAWKAAGFPVTK